MLLKISNDEVAFGFLLLTLPSLKMNVDKAFYENHDEAVHSSERVFFKSKKLSMNKDGKDFLNPFKDKEKKTFNSNQTYALEISQGKSLVTSASKFHSQELVKMLKLKSLNDHLNYNFPSPRKQD